jgi:multisubunit Na+/H+ antiporter MnhC subunit
MRPQRFLRRALYGEQWYPLRRALVWAAIVVGLWAAVFGFVYLAITILDP